MANTEEAMKARAREVRVSVIIPVRNGAETIARAIDSALAQTYTGGTEIVVANDGSADCTAEVLSRYGDRITAGRPRTLRCVSGPQRGSERRARRVHRILGCRR